ncbi:hypothetical protein C9E89_013335 [Acinetobacter sichuanensis]|uniref:Uncharacterized protein n=2 Tax=Acinetobacter sichuanensis TaxID=2136183 RepID=A0A371YNR5_9GAMM|nr:hypothetical protein C9E89_013335 [Acinetobacter sichuanensis]
MMFIVYSKYSQLILKSNYMNICIGGSWHGSQLLKGQKSNHFLAKDKATGQHITYERFVIKYENEVCTFWIANTLSRLEANEKMMFYLNQLKKISES